ncbi:SPOR domain-containing protein [Paenibacillus tundrae]
MSNARMTFRFGDKESDKPVNKGQSVVEEPFVLKEEIPQNQEPLHIAKTPAWEPEVIPVDWGETVLTSMSPSEPGSDFRSNPKRGQDHKPNATESPYAYSEPFDNLHEDDPASTRNNPEYTDHDWLATHDQYSYKRNRPPRGWKMIGSVTGALVTGALFGIVILSFFNKDGTDSIVNLPGNQTVSTVAEQEITAAAGESNQAAMTGGNYYALQYGVFSSPERAEQAKLELAQVGIAAGTDPEDGNRVYAGISADREEAKLLSSRLKAEGVELYVKEITVPAINLAAWGGLEKDVENLFASSSALVDQLSTLSINQLGQTTPQAVPAETMSVLQNQHESWLSGINSLAQGLNPEASTIVSSMEKSMNNAITAVTEYNKNPADVHMWTVQANLMEYVLEQKQWIEMMKQ